MSNATVYLLVEDVNDGYDVVYAMESVELANKLAAMEAEAFMGTVYEACAGTTTQILEGGELEFYLSNFEKANKVLDMATFTAKVGEAMVEMNGCTQSALGMMMDTLRSYYGEADGFYGRYEEENEE